MSRFKYLPFYVQSGDVKNRIYFVNRKESGWTILYNPESTSWEMVEWEPDGSHILMASIRSTEQDMALGTKEWTIYNDSKDCYNGVGDSYTTILTFSACTPAQYSCDDGNCVGMEQRCDGKFDCYDKTDEKECQLVTEDPSYSKGISPPPAKHMSFCELFLSVDIYEILKLDEIGRIFEIKFKMFVTWIDPRLTYQNLKTNKNLNVLQLEGQRKIWTPDIIFTNTKNSDQSIIDEKSSIRVLPDKDFFYEPSTFTERRNTYKFPGSRNFLELSRFYRIDFICNYDMALFPFDTQTCSMNFDLTEVYMFFINLVHIVFYSCKVANNFNVLRIDKLRYLGPLELTQYYVKEMNMTEVVQII